MGGNDCGDNGCGITEGGGDDDDDCDDDIDEGDYVDDNCDDDIDEGGDEMFNSTAGLARGWKPPSGTKMPLK